MLKNTDNLEVVKLELRSGDVHGGLTFLFEHQLKWAHCEFVCLSIAQNLSGQKTDHELPRSVIVKNGDQINYDIDIEQLIPPLPSKPNIGEGVQYHYFHYNFGRGMMYNFPKIKDMICI